MLPQVGIGDADALPGHARVQTRQVVGHRHAAAGRIARILARDRAQQRRRIADRARHRPEVIGRPGDRDAAVPADPAVGRFQPDDAAVGRRQPDRAARIRADRAVAHPGATATAEPLLDPDDDRVRSHGLGVGP